MRPASSTQGKRQKLCDTPEQMAPASRPLGAPRKPQERFLSVDRCPSQDETTSGGNDNEASRALLHANYLSTVWEDRQGCLG